MMVLRVKRNESQRGDIGMRSKWNTESNPITGIPAAARARDAVCIRCRTGAASAVRSSRRGEADIRLASPKRLASHAPALDHAVRAALKASTRAGDSTSSLAEWSSPSPS